MKYVISLFIASGLLAMSFKSPQQIEFHDLFKMAYEKSFDGLETMKDARTGKWVFDNATSDFNTYEVKFDLDKGLHVMNFVKELESESTAEQMMVRYQIQLERLLPQGQYERNYQLSTKRKTVYEFVSKDVNEKSKYPVAEILVEGDKTSARMTIKLVEPLNRKTSSGKK